MSNQSARQASIRAITGTEFTYNGDWMALFDASGIPAGEFNGRFLAWLNTQIPEQKDNLPDAMASYAINIAGVSCWNEVVSIVEMETFLIGFSSNNAITSADIANPPPWFTNSDFTIEWEDGVVAEFVWNGSGWDIDSIAHYPLTESGSGVILTQGANSTIVRWDNGTVFRPTSITSLELWLDADDASTITATSGAVSQWNDKSGNDYHATQSTGSNQPLTGGVPINGRNAITFDGTNDRMNLPSGLYGLPSSANTILAVATNTDISTAAARRVVSGKVNTASNYGIIYLPQTSILSVRNGGSNNQGITLDASAHILGLRRSGSSSENIYDAASAFQTNATNITLTELTLGWDIAGSANQALPGRIAEVCMFSSEISNDELSASRRYLKNKWGTP